MSRYIDADALHDALKAKQKWVVRCGDKHNEGYTYDQVHFAIDEAPSIDIEPKRGEWVKRTHDTLIAQVNFAYCSECGQPIMHEHTRPLWNFCPNCGVDMREREGE